MDCFLWAEASKDRNKLTAKYEPLQPFLFLSFLEFASAEVVLDVGANVGLYSFISTIASRVEAVYAFEPDEAAYLELEKNIHLNNLKKIVIPSQVAVSSAEGTVRFGSYAPMAGVNGVISTSIHDPAVFTESHDVPATTLGQLKSISGKVLGIKIDVEGHELQVIEGAKELLTDSPAIIQVEHYVGSGIDEKLNKLGYFCFFTAGQDYYFTNIRNFSKPLFVKRAVEHASTWLIETHAGRWPSINSVKHSLSLTCGITGDEIHAQASLKEGFFSEPEYAFYLMVDGVKKNDQWYRAEPYVTFKAPQKAGSIEVKGFVREKNFPEKKVIVGSFIKQPTTGYRAGSAVGESLGLPSQYAAVVNRLNDADESYADLNLSPLLNTLVGSDSTGVVQIGGSSDVFAIADNFQTSQQGCLSVLCSPSVAFSFKKEIERFVSPQRTTPLITVHNVSNAEEFETTLKTVAQRLKSVTHVLLRAQFLADIGVNVKELTPLLAQLPRGSTLYSEGLANDSYRQALTRLAKQYDMGVVWFYPLSTILPREQVGPLETHSVNNAVSSFDFYSHPAPSSGLAFDFMDKQHPEYAIGLDFWLSESRSES